MFSREKSDYRRVNTQFSYANRGGSGDIDDGLVDIKIFFKFVKKLNPKYWVMENVPRVKKILLSHMNEEGGALNEYKSILKNAEIKIIDCSEFGIPQKRKRMIAGNIDFDKLYTYKENLPTMPLWQVIGAFKEDENIKI